MIETTPEGFSLELEASRQDEAAMAGVEQRAIVPELLVADEELDGDGSDGRAYNDDDEAGA